MHQLVIKRFKPDVSSHCFLKCVIHFISHRVRCCGRNIVVCRSIKTLITLRVDLHIYEMENDRKCTCVCVDISLIYDNSVTTQNMLFFRREF